MGWSRLKLVEVGFFFRRRVEVGWSRLKLGENNKWTFTHETNSPLEGSMGRSEHSFFMMPT